MMEFWTDLPTETKWVTAIAGWICLSALMAYLSMRLQHPFGKFFNKINLIDKSPHSVSIVPPDLDWFSPDPPQFNGVHFARRFCLWIPMVIFWTVAVLINLLFWLVGSVGYAVWAVIQTVGETFVRYALPDLYQPEEAEVDN